jgi:glycerate dehydrogenase
MPRITVLDGHTLNPGDLDWSALEALGDLTVYDRTAPGEVVERCQGSEIVLSNKVPLISEHFAALPDLKLVSVLATGFNIIDTAAAKERGVTVCNVAGYSTQATAQHAFALLLALTNHVGQTAQDSGTRWPASADFAYWDKPLIELDGLTCGVIGFGSIGRAFADRAAAFGMKLLAHSRTPKDVPGVEFVGLDDLLRQSDVVSLHCPLTDQTKHLINVDRLALMKPTALLINVARGPVIDEAAVAAALNADKLAGAGVDVLSSEPPAADNPLLRAKNCLITPHQAWAATAARKRLMAETAANVKAFLDGHPQNVVNG